MAAETGEKTEPATPRRRNEARSKGQVARSHDLSVAVLLLVGLLAMDWLGPGLWRSLLSVMQSSLTAASEVRIDAASLVAITPAWEVARRLAPLLVLLFLAILATLLVQVGPLLTWQPLTPSLGKLNPLSGAKRLFSIRSLMQTALNCGKLVVVSVAGYVTMAGSMAAIVFAFSLGLDDVLGLGWSLTLRLGVALAVLLLVLALLDYAWQRYRFEKDLRMTKEEVKDELRSMEGDPAIKRRRRQLQLQMAMKRLRKEVPKADVVVTNPTHVAVAIQYDGQSMAAPKVVAKGADEIALKIRHIASEFGVPIVERRALARALYDAVEVGQSIPERFYRAIAEILAYVYELTGRSPAVA